MSNIFAPSLWAVINILTISQYAYINNFIISISNIDINSSKATLSLRIWVCPSDLRGICGLFRCNRKHKAVIIVKISLKIDQLRHNLSVCQFIANEHPTGQCHHKINLFSFIWLFMYIAIFTLIYYSDIQTVWYKYSLMFVSFS